MSIRLLVEVIMVVTVPAIGWLIATVIRHGKEITMLSASMPTRADLQHIDERVDRVASGVEQLRGDIKALHTRVDSLLRVVDRHERWLERGVFDRPGDGSDG